MLLASSRVAQEMETESASLFRFSSSTASVLVDLSSLLGTGNSEAHGESATSGSLPHFFRQMSQTGRMMTQSSMLVRETAAEQLEERQIDWAYSGPVVVLDLIWNLAFVAVTLLVLVLCDDERPCTRLHVWVSGYALQCLLHMSCVVSEYQRRRRSAGPDYNFFLLEEDDEQVSLAKHLESANTIFSLAWWIIGFYWITSGSETLAQTCPRVYWLCVVFLAFDVFFVVFCVALACVIGVAICCCLPCIIAILYAVTDQAGASDKDINQLPKLKFKRSDSDSSGGRPPLSGGGVVLSDALPERRLSVDDAECCICLSLYDDGAELCELPCSHHFHGSCIIKWLRINATCPLCKFNIVHRSRKAEEV